MLPSGWTGTSTSDTINVIADTTEGIIRLVAHNACGRSSDTQSISVTVSKVPAISALPASDACSGDTITLKVVNQNGTGYTWLRDGTVLSGSDSQLLVTQSGIFQIVHNDGSCTDTSSPVEVRIHPLPMPVIGEDNGELFTTQLFASYQWYYEGNLINGANDPTCEAKFEGRYQVEVTDSNGCVNISEEFDHYDKSGVQHWSQGEKIQIYPNPVSDQLYIRLDQAATVSIVAPDGKLALHTSVLNPGENVLATKSLPAGVYVVVVQSLKEGDLSYLKLIKL